MILVAHGPLADAKWALNKLDFSDDLTEYRVWWAATVALLRSVGHVLDKVDGASDRRLRLLIGEAWSDWRSDRETNAIFWEFIEKERNNVLKEYGFGYAQGAFQLVAAPVDDEPVSLGEVPMFLYAPMADGRYRGDDGRDVALEAVAWWEKQLNTIETKFRQLK